MRRLIVYTDFKSPYAYLAQAPICELADAAGAQIDWRPYTLDIPSYLGSAELGPGGEVIGGQRDAHQWRKVRYAYMDCRRQANRRGLTILGTRKIWDSRLAGIGLLWAKTAGEAIVRGYAARVFERFWRRELDIEDAGVIERVLGEAGASVTGFAAYAAGPGLAGHDAIRAEAEAMGVFGVPSLILDGELFWGREHLADIRERLAGEPAAGQPR